MPGTRARRAREYRAGASSRELIGERPTPANCVKHRRTVRMKLHKRPFFSQTEEQLYRRMLKKAVSKAAASEGGRRMLRYVEPLSDARTPLADFFSILLMAMHMLL